MKLYLLIQSSDAYAPIHSISSSMSYKEVFKTEKEALFRHADRGSDCSCVFEIDTETLSVHCIVKQ